MINQQSMFEGEKGALKTLTCTLYVEEIKSMLYTYRKVAKNPF